MRLYEFIQENNIRAIRWKVDSNPNMADSKTMDNWAVQILYKDDSYITYFSKGKSHKGAAPTIEEVLLCINQDIQSIEAQSVCDFIEEFGYECKEGYKVYNAIKTQREQLKAFFKEKYEEFISINTYEDD